MNALQFANSVDSPVVSFRCGYDEEFQVVAFEPTFFGGHIAMCFDLSQFVGSVVAGVFVAKDIIGELPLDQRLFPITELFVESCPEEFSRQRDELILAVR